MVTQSPIPSSIEIEYQDVDGARRLVLIDHAAVVGRSDDCDIQIRHELASRWHLRIFPEGEAWWVADLDSRNGTLVDGRRVLRKRLEGPANIQLGPQGASLGVRPVAARGAPDEGAGVARARDSNGWTIVNTAVRVGGRPSLSGAADRQPPAAIRPRIRWRLMLMLMLMLGAIPLVIALAILVVPRPGPDRLDRDSARIQADLAPDERLIRRVVEIWGDNPLTIPPDVIADVRRQIRAWQATEDLDRAMRRLNEGGFMPDIHRILTEARLAPQFLYLALVESGFRADAVVRRPDGTAARGLWSLTSEQARHHGLRLGSRPDAETYDAEDERHQVDRATLAAAERLAALHRTAAQGSGLLTLALYLDDGDDLGARLRALPETPAARDFWRLGADGVLPEAILERVLIIVAAATIGENPRLFGFLFDNPLNGIGTGTRRPPPHRELLEMLASRR